MNVPTSSLAQTSRSPRRRVLRSVQAAAVSLAVAAGAFVGSAALSDPPASAVAGGLPTNALANVVTTSAREALASYDSWIANGDAVSYRSYVWFRTQTAQFAARELGYAQLDMVRAWASTPLDHQRAVLAAMTQIGV